MPRIFDVTSERSTSPAPSPLSLVAQFVCFTGGVLCQGKKPTGHYIPDASLLRISFPLSLALFTSHKISYNLCTPFIKPKYFKTRVKERKASATSLSARNDGCYVKRWTYHENREPFTPQRNKRRLTFVFPETIIDFTTERNNAVFTLLDLDKVAI